jgi:hypothetical protein
VYLTTGVNLLLRQPIEKKAFLETFQRPPPDQQGSISDVIIPKALKLRFCYLCGSFQSREDSTPGAMIHTTEANSGR